MASGHIERKKPITQFQIQLPSVRVTLYMILKHSKHVAIKHMNRVAYFLENYHLCIVLSHYYVLPDATERRHAFEHVSRKISFNIFIFSQMC